MAALVLPTELRTLRAGCAVRSGLSCMEDTGVEPDRGDRLVQLFGQAQSRRRILRVLGGLGGATLGLRAVSEHAGAAPRIKQLPQYDREGHPHHQPFALRLDAARERVQKGR